MVNEADYNKKVAQNLRRLMYEKNITQAQMARDLGIKKGTISTWMNGVHLPRMDKIDRICHYLGCSRSDLLEIEPQRKTRDVTPEQAELIMLTMNAAPDSVRLALEIMRKMEGVK